MSSVVYRTIKGTKYAYLSESYWDSEKKAPRTRRKYLGKVDPESGQIIRVYKKSEKAKNVDDVSMSTEPEVLLEEIEKLNKEVQKLREQNASLIEKLTTLKSVFDSVS